MVAVIAPAPPTPASATASIPEPTSRPPDASGRCPPPATGQVSDDDTPTVGGVSTRVRAFEWLEARGVSMTSAVAWYAKRFGAIDPSVAEITFGEAACWTLTVGDPAEEAIVCEHALTYTFMQVRALALVVRNKRPVAVLDVGLGMRALDFLEARHLDLALSFDARGLAAELRDRAPAGTTLVEPPSECRRREAFLDACEGALPGGADPACPVVHGPGGEPRIARDTAAPSGYPATLNDCDAARAHLREVERELASTPAAVRKEARDAAVFVDRSCKERGRYAWRVDRFVRAAD